MPKTLSPALRERNRYLSIEVLSEQAFDKKMVSNAVWNAVIRLHGELGASKTSLWLIDYDSVKKKGVLKTTHKTVDLVKSSIALIKEIERKPAVVHVLRTSGTLKKAREI